MGNFWLKFRVWAKVVVFALAVLYVLLFIYNNTGKGYVELWFWFGTEPPIPPLLLVVVTFLAGALAAILLRTTLKTLAQIRELRRRAHAERADRALAEKQEQERKAAMLRTRSLSESDESIGPGT